MSEEQKESTYLKEVVFEAAENHFFTLFRLNLEVEGKPINPLVKHPELIEKFNAFMKETFGVLGLNPEGIEAVAESSFRLAASSVFNEEGHLMSPTEVGLAAPCKERAVQESLREMLRMGIDVSSMFQDEKESEIFVEYSAKRGFTDEEAEEFKTIATNMVTAISALTEEEKQQFINGDLHLLS